MELLINIVGSEVRMALVAGVKLWRKMTFEIHSTIQVPGYSPIGGVCAQLLLEESISWKEDCV